MVKMETKNQAINQNEGPWSLVHGPWSSKKILCFDFDGTLVDSMNWLADLAAGVMAEHYDLPPAEGRRLYVQTSGLAFCDQMAVLFPKEKTKNARANADFEAKKRKNYFEQIPFDDCKPTLQYLKEKKYAVAISSNSAADLVEKLAHQLEIPCDLALGWRKNFAKGADHFLYVLNRWGVRREETVFIGDSLKDGERAEENGIDFIGKVGLFSAKDFQNHFPKAMVISTLVELKVIF
ncbi:MAG: HAD family hydrolase [Deltaproteobacteria bacterium]|nr:HAD family hydrolase [Deltaproteobacteria bacterium]